MKGGDDGYLEAVAAAVAAAAPLGLLEEGVELVGPRVDTARYLLGQRGKLECTAAAKKRQERDGTGG